ncbi:MAG: hypothetical protein ACK4SA_15295 [Caldilinea sp.]
MLTNDTRKQLLRTPEGIGTALLVAAADLMEDLKDAPHEEGSWLDQSWDPLAIKLDLMDLVGEPIPEDNFNRIMAAREIINSDAFYHDLVSFIAICNGLASGVAASPPDDFADVEEITWSVVEAAILWPFEDGAEPPFSHEIKEYIRVTLKNEGFFNPPEMLRFAGLDNSAWGRVQEEFSDDPIMFEMIHQKAMEKTSDVDELVRRRLGQLQSQLDRLILNHGDTKDALQTALSEVTRAASNTRRSAVY